MKQLLTIIAVMFCISLQAQTVDTVGNSVQIKPVINHFTHDTAYQLKWRIINVERDSTSPGNTYVELFDRKGKKVYDCNISIPRETINAWVNDVVIDNYIMFVLHLEKRN